jgi:phospholipase/lecithinase/hemolysin
VRKSFRAVILIAVVASLIFLILLTHRRVSASEFSKIYVFGDSLSDTGNAFSKLGLPSAPYANGRFSNGLIWIDDLAQDLGLNPVLYTAIANDASLTQGINFAFSGATTGQDNIGSDALPGLQQQISYFTRLIPAQQTADPSALYIIWAGANDYLHGVTDINQPLANLTEAVHALTELGAHTILVVNLPDLGSLPATRDTPASEALNRLTSLHNAKLAEAVRNLDQHLDPEFNLLILDVNLLFQQALAGELRFTNVSDGCFNQSTGVICENPDDYLFWDGIHPTMTAHQQVKRAALAQLQSIMSMRSNSQIPAIGLGMLAVGRLDRRSMVGYRL